MLSRHGQEKYNRLGKAHPSLTYEHFEITKGPAELRIDFYFKLEPNINFHPRVSFPIRDFYSLNNIDDESIELLAFNLGLTEMISYWKAACPPQIVVRAGHLDQWQQNWWKKLFYKGLGEFFHTNGIVPEFNGFLNFKIESDKTFKSFAGLSDKEVILPVGGGKDSVVSMELLRKHDFEIRPFIINPAQVHNKILGIAGYPEEEWIVAKRVIAPELLQLNQKGYLNGHTPFSAIVAIVSSMGALLSNNKFIALSNESSANEPTIPETGVNHQYSKSIEFESDFRNYTRRYISPDLDYFSLLRPLNELQIAKLFSSFKPFHLDFRSCNTGSKKGIWCCSCPKCLFTFIILSTFIPAEKMKKIFGKDLFGDEELLDTLWQLTGDSKEKPFECVGTIEEVNAALDRIILERKDDLPVLLKTYKSNRKSGKKTGEKVFNHLMDAYDPDNFLRPAFEKMIMQEIQWKNS